MNLHIDHLFNLSYERAIYLDGRHFTLRSRGYMKQVAISTVYTCMTLQALLILLKCMPM